jgi:prepilin-type N-terminal cleavage/methylation domain-containing protein
VNAEDTNMILKDEIIVKKAFTLVELLVVIAIIALLLSILMPTLSKARKLGRSSVCLFNTRQIAIAFQAYSIDNKGDIVPSYVQTGQNNAWVQYPQNSRGQNTYFEAKLTIPLEQTINGIKAGLLYPYLKDYKVYHCPGDPRIGGPTKGYRTYSMIACLNGWAPDPKYLITKIEQIKSTSMSFMLVEETDSRGQNHDAWTIAAPEDGYNPPQWWSPLAILHGDSSTMAFSDGHSKLHKWSEQLTIKLAQKVISPGQNYGVTVVPNDQRRDIDYIYQGWAYKYHP